MSAGKKPVETTVLSFIREHGLLTPGQRVLVGVSGGPDSVCLLHILHALKDELKVELHVAHLDHQLRGDEARGDAEYVAQLAKSLDIPATIEAFDVKAFQKQHHLSMEEAAREVRYEFFARIAKETGAACVAVGHTTDDHIETMLMHLIRGSGVNGLRGLLPENVWKRERNHVSVIRPILLLTRQATTDYCLEHHLEPRTDSTNISMSPLRNRIRLQLLPLLREYNPQVSDALLRTSRIAAADLDFLAQETAKAWRKTAREEKQTVIYDKLKFLKLAPAVQRELLLKGIEKTLGKLKDIELAHVEEVMDALHKPAGKQIALPQGLTFVIEYERYLLGKDPAALSPFPPLEGEYKLNVPGKTVITGWEITATIQQKPVVILTLNAVKGKNPSSLSTDSSVVPTVPIHSVHTASRMSLRIGTSGLLQNDNANRHLAIFDFAKTRDRLTVRPRRPGDRFQPLGLNAEKKLNQFMIDARIPHAWRERIPLVCSPDQILWVVGYRTDERVKVTEATKQVLEVEFRRT